MGILDFFGGTTAQQQRINTADSAMGNSQPGGVYNRETYGILGPSQGRQPLSDEQRRSILFSAISDAVDSLQGRDGQLTQQMSGQFAQDNAKAQAAKRRTAINQAIQTAISQGDMQGARAAIMQADPQDVAHITQALQFGQPKIQDVGGAGYSVDPFTGKATQIIPGKPENPLINGGLMSPDHGKTWAPIPGYVDQQKAIAGAKRKPGEAAAIQGPWQRFGGQ